MNAFDSYQCASTRNPSLGVTAPVLFNFWNVLYILKPSSNWSLFKPIISDQKLIKFKRFFAYIYVYFNGQTFSSVFEQFSFTSKFFGLKCKNLRIVFIKLTFRWLQTGLSDLKNIKQLEFGLW